MGGIWEARTWTLRTDLKMVEAPGKVTPERRTALKTATKTPIRDFFSLKWTCLSHYFPAFTDTISSIFSMCPSAVNPISKLNVQKIEFPSDSFKGCNFPEWFSCEVVWHPAGNNTNNSWHPNRYLSNSCKYWTYKSNCLRSLRPVHPRNVCRVKFLFNLLFIEVRAKQISSSCFRIDSAFAREIP